MDKQMGRPPHYETPEDMQSKIDEYFNTEGERCTITGLALHMGFESRQSFYDNEKNSNFSYILKRARLRIENKYENLLISDKVTGPIFALKQFGWTDRTEVKHEGGETPLQLIFQPATKQD